MNTYRICNMKIEETPSIRLLVSSDHKEAQEMIVKGMSLRWEYFLDSFDTPLLSIIVLPNETGTHENKYIDYVISFCNVVTKFNSKIHDALDANENINKLIREIEKCSYNIEFFRNKIDQIQAHIDKLNFQSFSNLSRWVEYVDEKIEVALKNRLQDAIKLWIEEFNICNDGVSSQDKSENIKYSSKKLRRRELEKIKNLNEKSNQIKPKFDIQILEILTKDQSIYLDPPLEEARKNLYFCFHQWISTICALPRINSSAYGNTSDSERHKMDYSNLINMLEESYILGVYQTIESKLNDISMYVCKWLEYQSLWDIESDIIHEELKDDIKKWQCMILDIKKARSTFDTNETEKSFGSILIDYEQVQNKVNSKYDYWQKEITKEFGNKLHASMKDFVFKVSKARDNLESFSLETNTTSETVEFITATQNLKKMVQKWSSDVEVYEQGQKTLDRQRYQFSKDWVYFEQIEGEWGAFNEIFRRKNKVIQDHFSGLQSKIIAEDRIVDKKINDIITEWDNEKPIQGDFKAEMAINVLNGFEIRLNKLVTDYEQLSLAKEALNLESAKVDRLSLIKEELNDLKTVWANLSVIWNKILDLKEISWLSIIPRKLKQTLDGLLEECKTLPNKIRQYSAYEHLHQTIKNYLKVNPIVNDLKSDSIKERHWNQLFKELKMSKRPMLSEMTLSDIWNLDLKINEKPIKDIITVAQGEMALEEYLKQVNETWSTYTLDLINYQNKCRLIRGWEDLMTKCSENLNSLNAMKLSPYYKVFEQEASNWEDRLNKINYLFLDIWIDVQRQWVYLEGIFSSSVDIKHLLPMETSRFQNINTEFLGILKRAYKSPLILDVLTIPNLEKSLERLRDLLTKIQKSLGEYLEKERSAFPRFYFVGDEDLLEIIGNGKDILKIQKHFKKMFAGLNGVILEPDSNKLLAMTSKEGEEIPFHDPIVLSEDLKINEKLKILETNMKVTLAYLLENSIQKLTSLYKKDIDQEYLEWVDSFPAQLITLASQILWTSNVEKAFSTNNPIESLKNTFDMIEKTLVCLANKVLTNLATILRKKCEHLITELVHQRDVIKLLINKEVKNNHDFSWLYQMRFYYDDSVSDYLLRLTIKMSDSLFYYGFEYLGITDKLVQTNLTDDCYLTLTQALGSSLGGSPFGPAGTGKTESVKALGAQLGRFVLVFCCDENFDFHAMGRIFVGLCQVGAWGCFDEFNRLEENILSAVSQQIQILQLGLKKIKEVQDSSIEFLGKNISLNKDTGIFITMNPGYAGRSNLPDNLKKLFRSIAMTSPDKELIAQVMLYSQGFSNAETLSSKIVPLFNLCLQQLSSQPHYDFGLRALKSVLVSAGNLKRDDIIKPNNSSSDSNLNIEYFSSEYEQTLLIRSIKETLMPKLISDDILLLESLLNDVFPGVNYSPVDLKDLSSEIEKVCSEKRLMTNKEWFEKIVQLYQIQNIHHGVMMVGSSGSGKSTSWKVLLTALSRIEGIEGVSYIIDPKSISKESLYGSLDSTTREWTDGLFTHILRKILDNLKGEDSKRHWIVFDGDVDPEWVENLNSVLDDNKLLTLPNGERLIIPQNVRIFFEVENLKYATLATVSRCGMIWYNNEIVNYNMLVSNYLKTLISIPFDDLDSMTSLEQTDFSKEQVLNTQVTCSNILSPFFDSDSIVEKTINFCYEKEHIMEFTLHRALSTLFSLINKDIRTILSYNSQHADFSLTVDQLENFLKRKLVINLIWSFSGDCKQSIKNEVGEFIRKLSTIELPNLTENESLIDYDVLINNGDWYLWQNKVPSVEIETQSINKADVVIPTVDTIRHEEILYSWLSEHKTLMLCGPPGSGKTMTLFSALRKLPDMEVVGLNFSSASTPELIIKTFDQYCEYRKTINGVTLSPSMIGRWLVIFCDEINLPSLDKYGTQKVISFMRQLIEHNGFWRIEDKSWVTLERIQFVGACNPPSDPGRVVLTNRFLRHCPLIMVDYPGQASLTQIYGTFTRAMLKVIPDLRGYTEPLTNSMIEFFIETQNKFTSDIQAHYIYSPRELTRWIRGIFEAIKELDTLDVEGLVRIWAHEALRLFQDRLVNKEEKIWTDELVNSISHKNFPNIDIDRALNRPILYSNWLSKEYSPVDRDELRDYAKARLKIFYEEELDVPLVLFDDMLEHALRIDRVFRQPQGHALLIGISGSGKTTLSRFVAWMNGLSIFQIKAHNNYTGEDFDEDLRNILRRCGCKGEKICFIMDEANVLDSGFLERMNTLLANSEVPGLFEGEEYISLMAQCKEGAQRENLLLDSSEELYKWFTQQVTKNLHVVFTMNPPESGLATRAATSPALFNRCVLDWLGDWTDQAFFQVGKEFTNNIDLELQKYDSPPEMQIVYKELSLPCSYREAIINAFVFVHYTLYKVNDSLSKNQDILNYATPRHYLDFINQFVKIYNEKREELEDQQRHLNLGLDKLNTTVVQVEELRKKLAIKKTELETKSIQANEKLKEMVSKQQEAEKNKEDSIKLQGELEVKNKEIAERKTTVEEDLSKAEPAVIEAQKSVKGIKKQHLTEVRSMANPPAPVKLAMESVCILLGNKIDGWKTVQSIIRKDDFISSIENFDSKKLTKFIREKIKKEYSSNPSFNFEVVNRASKACGPLVQWVIAQLEYSEILEKIGPLRKEVSELEETAEKTKTQADTIEETIIELENSISVYKEEYANLISETQAIKNEMEIVKNKVDRSLTLIESLSSEKIRWEKTSQSFEYQMSTMVGDSLISSAYLVYSGYFDLQYRDYLLKEWKNHLLNSNIEFEKGIRITEFLSTADEKLKWEENELPNDDICIENAIMLHRFSRYPLIIDPSGQATKFLSNLYQDKKIVVTSFLDNSFLKNLESSLRFGNPILIQDVENIDPILNSVLNKEIRRTGGRVLIRIGNQDIDFSPSFTLFLSTRNPSCMFSPDISSRVTFVNFTITTTSLQSQCLNIVLKKESPETESKRLDLIKLQGEFKLKLRNLEKLLLKALSDSKGSILDDDSVIESLEKLKKEATTITKKVEETDEIIKEVEETASIYEPLAKICSDIYFSIDQLKNINRFYQFSLGHFNAIFYYCLNNLQDIDHVTDPRDRVSKIILKMFKETYIRTAFSLLNDDHYILNFMFCRIFLDVNRVELVSEEMDFLLYGGEITNTNLDSSNYFLDDLNFQKLISLSSLGTFTSIFDHINNNLDIWEKFIKSNYLDLNILDVFVNNSLNEIDLLFKKILLIKCAKPQFILEAMNKLCDKIFDEKFYYNLELNLKDIALNEVGPNTPIALCSVAGYDASFKVENLVKELNVKCTTIAMGSAESISLADEAISSSSKSGNWVFLKNVHLAINWLSQFEKTFVGLNTKSSFRLFLTMEINQKVPINLIRSSRSLLFEAPPGIKANLQESLNLIPKEISNKDPIERSRLHFLLAWLHAIIQERLRYSPIGWTKSYEFNDSDFICGISIIDTWVDKLSQGRSNISPEKIPWDAIKSLISKTVYGGKIDNKFDRYILDSFIGSLFSVDSYDSSFSLVKSNENSLIIPDVKKIEDFTKWVNDLKNEESPSFLGLSNNSDELILIQKADLFFHKFSKLKSTKNISLNLEPLGNKSQKNDGADNAISEQPAWIQNVYKLSSKWIQNISFKLMKLDKSEVNEPIYRFFKRENLFYERLFMDVKKDLNSIIYICLGQEKSSNFSRIIMSEINIGAIPNNWKRYKTLKNFGLNDWINDLIERLNHHNSIIENLNKNSDNIRFPVHLSQLFNPEAYITASRQSIAQNNKCSLEKLKLRINLDTNINNEKNSFYFADLSIYGAKLTNFNGSKKFKNAIKIDDTSLINKIPLSSATWINIDEDVKENNMVHLPIYFNADRETLLIEFDYVSESNTNEVIQRSIALFA